MVEINKQHVGTRIKSIRQSKGMTLEEFGKLFAASKGNVSLWESGSSIPSNERLKTIAKLGDMTVNFLLYGSEDLNYFDEGNVRVAGLVMDIFKMINSYEEHVQEFKDEISFEHTADVSKTDFERFVEETVRYMAAIKMIAEKIVPTGSAERTIERLMQYSPEDLGSGTEPDEELNEKKNDASDKIDKDN